MVVLQWHGLVKFSYCRPVPTDSSKQDYISDVALLRSDEATIPSVDCARHNQTFLFVDLISLRASSKVARQGFTLGLRYACISREFSKPPLKALII